MKKCIMLLAVVSALSGCSMLKSPNLADIPAMIKRVQLLKSFISSEPAVSGNSVLDSFVGEVFNSSKESVGISEQLIGMLQNGGDVSKLDLLTLASKIKGQRERGNKISGLMDAASQIFDSERGGGESTSALSGLFDSAKDANSVLDAETSVQSSIIEMILKGAVN